MGKILVIGSSNLDLIAKMDRFPLAGETLEGKAFLQAMGGKGANQAVAANKSGSEVKFVTSLGNDNYGKNILKKFSEQVINMASTLLVDDKPTGTAMIWVDDSGENSIVIIPGANNMLTSDYIVAIEDEISNAEIVMLQMEIPYETVKTVCDIAYNKGTKVMLNVAPARELDISVLKAIHVLVVNETEAEIVASEKISEIGEEAIAGKLISLGVKNVVLTMGEKGSLFKNKDTTLQIPAFNVNSVDTTAAGDTFCGALAAGISNNKSWEEALKFATAAAALCVTKMGAQPSIPSEKEICEFMKEKIAI